MVCDRTIRAERVRKCGLRLYVSATWKFTLSGVTVWSIVIWLVHSTVSPVEIVT